MAPWQLCYSRRRHEPRPTPAQTHNYSFAAYNASPSSARATPITRFTQLRSQIRLLRIARTPRHSDALSARSTLSTRRSPYTNLRLLFLCCTPLVIDAKRATRSYFEGARSAQYHAWRPANALQTPPPPPPQGEAHSQPLLAHATTHVMLMEWTGFPWHGTREEEGSLCPLPWEHWPGLSGLGLGSRGFKPRSTCPLALVGTRRT